MAFQNFTIIIESRRNPDSNLTDFPRIPIKKENSLVYKKKFKKRENSKNKQQQQQIKDPRRIQEFFFFFFYKNEIEVPVPV